MNHCQMSECVFRLHFLQYAYGNIFLIHVLGDFLYMDNKFNFAIFPEDPNINKTCIWTSYHNSKIRNYPCMNVVW